MLVYEVSYSGLGWTLPAEVYSSTSRSKGVALATAVVWLCNFIVGVIIPPVLDDIGFGTYVFFGAFCYAGSVWAFFLVPEIKGKTLEKMKTLFGDNAASEEEAIVRGRVASRDERKDDV